MSRTIDSKVELNNGVQIPYLGLGVYLISSGNIAQDVIHKAFDIGYRHIDTAKFYDNEPDVGKAVRESKLPREKIFVTTKLWNSDHGYDRSIKAFHESLQRLGLNEVDLYLIHWPVEELRHESWRALETLLEEQKCRAIGVSNYTIRHLNELLQKCRHIPSVNQVEFSPFLYQRELLDFCKHNKIQLEAYSPLIRGKKFRHNTIRSISSKYQKTPAQIFLRWALQHDVIIIPKSANAERLQENADIFNFSIEQEDMDLLDSLNENFRVSWDPTNIP